MGIFDFLKGKKKSTPKKKPVVIRKPETAGKQPQSPKQRQVLAALRCGMCGEKITGNHARRNDLDILICTACIPKTQSITSDEKVSSCRSCGFKFLPGYSKWYYSAEEPLCPACGKPAVVQLSYTDLMQQLAGKPSLQNASEIIQIITYGKPSSQKGRPVNLTDTQKVALLKKLIDHDELFVHYSAYLKLLKLEGKVREVTLILDNYEQKHIKSPRIKKAAKQPVPKQPLQRQPAIQSSRPQIQKFATKDEWREVLKKLPIDISHKRDVFKYDLEKAITTIDHKISLPSMQRVTLNLSQDRRCFILGHTDSHWHEIWRTGPDEYTIHTRRR